jgi:hypothetical protein
MQVALGTKAHSGWAALVVVGRGEGGYVVVDRRRIELVEEVWARQPYHTAEPLSAGKARAVVTRGIAAAHAQATRELGAAIARARAGQHEVKGCAVLVGEPMPAWSVDEILAVHFRMHKAEGVLFREALVAAANACGVMLVSIPEKRLASRAEEALGIPARRLDEVMKTLGKPVGAPWGRDQKDAALAAIVALESEGA